jgi:SAM-dependent methyltransferase
MAIQAEIDRDNRQFWEELCGSAMARHIGETGSDARSIANYDQFFFDFYYYVDRFIPFDELAGKDVLEIGLGYGSVSQRLAAAKVNFTGLDIAQGPVGWVNYRLGLNGLPGKAVEGSALDMPFESESFDYVVSIGCLHHTGNLKRGISEVHRVLRPGGRATIMIYNATSYLRWIKYPVTTLKYSMAVLAGEAEPLSLDEQQRKDFDANKSGLSAPETVAASKLSLARMLGTFSHHEVHRTNVADHRVLYRIPRRWRNEMAGPLLGLDLYALVVK